MKIYEHNCTRMKPAYLTFIMALIAAAPCFANSRGTGRPAIIISRNGNFYNPKVKNTFQSFSATRQGHNVQLGWASLNELNDQYYAMERSTDGYTWKQIAVALGIDAAKTDIGFAYIDKNISNAVVYYRIRQVDANKIEHYSSVCEVRNGGDNNKK